MKELRLNCIKETRRYAHGQQKVSKSAVSKQQFEAWCPGVTVE